ncbi:MAG TPA: DUF4129 domain-containing protein [Verrucomicrobiae bacterium]|nr:DUF4129 domain-containing protein [Verrucomicrobiae bacterium]
MRDNLRQRGKGAIDLVEEAVHLLRLCPVRVFVLYYLGSVPFILGLLYFWADMSASAFAYRHCSEAALGLSLLYLWMKCWQSVFAHHLHARLCGKSSAGWSVHRLVHLVVAQTIIQSTALFVMPVAVVIALPVGWAYAFYQNASLYGDGELGDIREVIRTSWRQASLWPGQNHLLLGLLYAFGFFIFLNLMIAILLLPYLLHTLLGIENVFNMSGLSLLNTTFFTAVCGLTYLCVNPLIKTVYVLRCFYGQSLRTGEDLKTEVRSLLTRGMTMTLAAMLLVGVWASPLRATPPSEVSKPPPTTSVSPADLDRSITEVINHPEYAWRMPREKITAPDANKSLVARFLDALIDIVSRQWRAFKHWLSNLADKITDFLRKYMKSDQQEVSSSSFDWMTMLHVLVFALIALVACALTLLIWKVWRERRRPLVVAATEIVAPVPDLADENVVANQLPAEGWLEQAQRLLEQGELRLALRALYLASLAHLAQRELIVIAKFKSNRDYQSELQRRAHSRQELLAAFGQNVSLFESAWYGMHEVTEEIIRLFTANLEQIRGPVES